MTLVPADSCTEMAQIRTAIDALDRRLVALLAERLGYIAAAARVKQARDSVRDEARKAEVIAKVVAQARHVGLPEDLPRDLWEKLIEYSIAYELALFDQKDSAKG